ncbi:hypothetical protein CLU99_3270 [Flavobacterium sp. 2]|nr:hypothetical protein CLU99_3270 [Flavobacterium sp. 2]
MHYTLRKLNDLPYKINDNFSNSLIIIDQNKNEDPFPIPPI